VKHASRQRRSTEALIKADLTDLGACLDRPLTVADVAGRAAMTLRTFARAFAAAVGMPPMRWPTRRRVAAAQELLETTMPSVEQVAARIGSGSAASLRAYFGAVAATASAHYRQTFVR